MLDTAHLDADLKGRSVRGGALTLTSQGVQFVVQTASTVALARLLTPVDFGLVAMVTAVTGLASAFADFGLSEATIQQKEINQDQVSTLFWINVLIGLALTVATAAMAPLLAAVYHEPRLRGITFALSLTFLIGGLRVQPSALLRRQMRFAALAVRDIASGAVAVLIAIAIAWKGAGYWALVAYPLIANSLQMVLAWLMVGWIPGPPRLRANVRSMLTFGGNVSLSYVIFNLNRSADGALIGWFWGAGPLGLYSRAYNLLMLPVRQLSAPMASVAVPALSRLQDDADRFARFYLRAAKLAMWIYAPILGFLFVAARPVIALVLGPQWGGAAPVFQILALSAIAQLFLEMSVWLFVSRGLSRDLLLLLVVFSPVLLGSFAIGLPYGIRGVALAGSIAQMALLPWILHYTFRGTNLTLRQVGEVILCPVALCLAAITSTEVALRVVAPDHTASTLLTAALAFAATYLLSAAFPVVRDELRSFGDLMHAFNPSRPIVESAR